MNGARGAERLVLHLVAAPQADLGAALADRPPEATALRRDPDCFVGPHAPISASLEARGASRTELAAFAASLEPLIDPERSMAIAGVDRVFIAPGPSTVRYQYLMHRRSDFTHEEYLDRYERVHSRFGLETPHIEGYVQLHVDLDRSASLAEETGLRAPACDSMSELYLQSVTHFLDGITAHPEVGIEAQADEERFVDRERSFGFCHRVLPS